jgi:hypothetical protein
LNKRYILYNTAIIEIRKLFKRFEERNHACQKEPKNRFLGAFMLDLYQKTFQMARHFDTPGEGFGGKQPEHYPILIPIRLKNCFGYSLNKRYIV